MVDLIGEGEGRVFRGLGDLAKAMHRVTVETGLDKVNPHDLRRTFSSTITWAGFSQGDMDRVLNHKTGGVTGTYDRSQQQAKFWEITTTVVSELLNRATPATVQKIA